METRREAVKDIVREYLERWFGELPDSSYEHACNLADCVFYALGISDEGQDRPPEITFPRRLPIVVVGGGVIFSIFAFGSTGMWKIRMILLTFDPRGGFDR